MTKLEDEEFTTKSVTKVEPSDNGYSITTDDGWSFFSPSLSIVPRIGSTATFYGRGIGSIVRGLDIDGQEVFYRTPEEQTAQNLADIRQREDEKQTRLNVEMPDRDARWLALPMEFQDRFARFVRNNPNFRRDLEPYELMVCEQAVAMARRFDTEEKIKTFSAADWADQEKMFPEIDKGHSGNSFGASIRLAYLFLTNPKTVDKMHGAMCPLMGCKEYGCYASEEQIQKC